jgi:hypothetical protein
VGTGPLPPMCDRSLPLLLARPSRTWIRQACCRPSAARTARSDRTRHERRTRLPPAAISRRNRAYGKRPSDPKSSGTPSATSDYPVFLGNRATMESPDSAVSTLPGVDDKVDGRRGKRPSRRDCRRHWPVFSA